VLDQIFGHKINEYCWGLAHISEVYLLSFPIPTQAHFYDTQSNGYGHFGTATCGVSGSLQNRVNERIESFGTLSDSADIMTSSSCY
jgi:hypothetical protein